MHYSVYVEPVEGLPGFTRVVVTFANGLRAETTVKGGEQEARWYVEQAFVPDLRRQYPELRGEDA